MKKNFLLILLLLVSASMVLEAQIRYLEPVFNDVKRTDGIPYGEAVEYDGDTVTLRFDLYEPVDDTLAKRPLIIWMHGGGFVAGTRKNGFNAYFAENFAKRGYTCASIDYRLGLESGNQLQAFGRAIYRGVQDANAAIRFFRRYAGQYHIDTSFIGLAGSSAGSVTAIHTAYWDQKEVPPFLDVSGLGKLEGTSGNPGYSTEFNVVINCWGAITDTNYIDFDELPIVSVHGTEDHTVPYESNGLIHGSAPIHRTAERLFIPNALLPFQGADHLLIENTGGIGDNWVESAAFIADFLYHEFHHIITLASPPMAHDQWCYPSITTGKIVLNEPGIESIRVYDLQGKLHRLIQPNNQVIHLGGLDSGIYFLRAIKDNESFISRIVKR